jgi:hypothetical protein
MLGITVFLMTVGFGLSTGCGPSDLGVGESCTEHDECAAGYCNLDASGDGQCDTNDFGAPCSDSADCAGLCQAAPDASGDASGYCTRACDNLKDCSAEPGWFCSSLGPGSQDICRRE